MTTQRQLDAIVRELEPELRQALLDAFAGIREGVDMTALRAAVDRGDVAAVEEALNVDEGSFTPYVIAATLIFMRYGQAYAPTLDPNLRFNATGPEGRDIIAQNVSDMTENTRQMARNLVAAGVGRRDVARTIRESIGLSTAQSTYVQSMRARLESGDPAQLRAILAGQTLRDKRFDPTIRRAIATGEVISTAQIRKMTDAYTRKLRNNRAKNIAQAEAQQYAEAAKFQAAKQLGEPVRKTWRHSRIWLRARQDHVMMNGVSVDGIDTAFVMPDGTPMQYAHDPAGGAKHNANCRCQTRYRKIKLNDV